MIKVLFSYQCVCRPHFFRSKKKRSEGRVRADSSAGKSSSLQGAPHLPVSMPSAPFLMLTLLLPPPGGGAQAMSLQSLENVTTSALPFHIPSVRPAPSALAPLREWLDTGFK